MALAARVTSSYERYPKSSLASGSKPKLCAPPRFGSLFVLLSCPESCATTAYPRARAAVGWLPCRSPCALPSDPFVSLPPSKKSRPFHSDGMRSRKRSEERRVGKEGRDRGWPGVG